MGFSAINNTTVSITGLQVAEYSQLHITLLEINGTKTATAISQGLDFTAIDSLGRKIFHSVAPAFIFEPMAILIEAASFSKVPQFKKDIIDLDLTMSLEVLPSEDYSSLTLEFPIGFNLMPRITKIGGLTPNYGTRMSTPNILEIYSQQPYSKSLVIETKLNLLVRNVNHFKIR